MDAVFVNHETQALATQLHIGLSELLSQAGTDTSTLDTRVACRDLQALFSANKKLRLVLDDGKHSSAADDSEDLQEACSRRASVLDGLLQQLDDAVCSLRSQLDDCQQLLKVSPCMSNPETIMQYAYTLRYGFRPLGIPEFHFPAVQAPAPQVFNFIPSLLKKYHESKSRQQVPAAPRPPAVQPAEVQPQQQQLYQAPPPQTQQQQQLAVEPAFVQQPGIFLQDLNPDLSDTTVEEETSDTDDDDSADW